MARTLSQLVDVVEQAISGAADPRMAARDVINEAGQMLVSCHNWDFLERPTYIAAFTANQNYTALPSDFAQLVDVQTYNNILTVARIVSRGDLEVLRSRPIQTTLDRFVAVEFPTQTSTAVPAPVARLAVWPTPTADEANALRVIYRAGWVTLSDNTSVANIPEAMEGVLIEMARALALGRRPGDSSLARTDQILQSQTLKVLKARYSTVQSNLGPMQGGAVKTNDRFIYRPYTSITSSG